MPGLQQSDISLIAGVRFLERGIQIDEPSSLRIGDPFLKGFRNPRIIILHDELGHLRPFTWRKSLELFDDFRRAHDGTISDRLPHRKSDSLGSTRSLFFDLCPPPSVFRPLTSDL